jgi:hypothetical protein
MRTSSADNHVHLDLVALGIEKALLSYLLDARCVYRGIRLDEGL